MNDRTLKSAMNAVPENSIILFEDIDCMKAGNRRPELSLPTAPQSGTTTAVQEGSATPDRSGATLSGLLNVLDGFTLRPTWSS
jgi:mitochondrial chaperone BCS1